LQNRPIILRSLLIVVTPYTSLCAGSHTNTVCVRVCVLQRRGGGATWQVLRESACVCVSVCLCKCVRTCLAEKLFVCLRLVRVRRREEERARERLSHTNTQITHTYTIHRKEKAVQQVCLYTHTKECIGTLYV